MQLKFLFRDEKSNEYFFKAEDFSPVQINTLRRVIIEEVPTFAIEEVYFRYNNSALYDEQLALRLGLIPLTTDLNYNFRNECSCGGVGCSFCEVKFKLKKEGEGWVYSRDLESSDPNVVPVFDNIPIVWLEKWQKVDLEATAILGRGKEHAKWKPAHVYYFELPEVKKGNKKLSEEEIAKLGLEKIEIMAQKGEVKVEYKPNQFIFVIEPFGQLDVKTILLRACDEIINNFEKMEEIKEENEESEE
jgi:DNA-directed RNA polymerase subunit D